MQGVACGVILLAGGLTALALMPRAGWGWTIPPQILVGAGLGLTVAGLTELALRGRADQVVHGGWTLAARHAGVVLGLLLLAPVLTSALDENRDEAIRAGAAVVLDSDIPPLDKLGVAQDVLAEVDRANDVGELPDVARALAGQARRRCVALAHLEPPGPARSGRDERVLRPVPPRGRTDVVRPRAAAVRAEAAGVRRFVPFLVALGLVAAVVVPYLALGGGSFEPTPVADPCEPREQADADGVGETIERIALRAVDGVACELGVSREELVLALRSEDAFDCVLHQARHRPHGSRARDPRRSR